VDSIFSVMLFYVKQRVSKDHFRNYACNKSAYKLVHKHWLYNDHIITSYICQNNFSGFTRDNILPASNVGSSK